MKKEKIICREPRYSFFQAILVFIFSALTIAGCAHYEKREMVVTAYSSDKISTNWRRGKIFFWRAYVASGPNKGRRKKVGITSSGTKAKKGTIAADIKYYPYGTIMKIPGYGKGVVEDIGSAIKGQNRLDVYMSSRKKALKWGRKTLKVKIRKN
jgi:3D (Asp-Asp-Asp) domain-containing protein